MGSAITGLGMAVPDGRLTNEDLAQRVDVSPDWIVERTGIRERRVAGPGDTTLSLALAASKRALAHASVDASDLDQIIVATVTADNRFPSTACLLQSALGAGRTPAWDLAAGCSGFLFALSQADAAIQAGTADRVLVCGVDVLSRVTNYEDPKSCVLFGDGAGALVVERVEGRGDFGPFRLYSDGSEPELLWVPPDGHYLEMQGREVYRHAVEGLTRSIEEVLAALDPSEAERPILVPHQANGRILEAVARRLGFDPDRVVSNIDRYGNTSSGSIPIALCEAYEAGRLEPGDLVVVSAFGAGFAWGAGSFRWRLETPVVGLDDAKEAAHV